MIVFGSPIEIGMKNILIFLTLILCSSSELSWAQKNSDKGLSARFETLLVLGDDENESADYLFGMPWHVVGEADGYIFVADRAVLGIKVYDWSGVYLRQIGSRGRAPGEFQDITGMSLDFEGNLVVADGSNRRISKFSRDGVLLHDENFDRVTMMWPRRMLGLASGEMLFLYKLPGVIESRGLVRPDSSTMFHVYAADYGEKITTFGDWEEILEGDGLKEVVATYAPGNMTLSHRNGTMVYAPAIYEGNLYTFELSDGDWKKASILKGKPVEVPYTEHDPEVSQGVPGVAIYRGANDYAAEVHSISLGVYYLNDGKLVHFLGFKGEIESEIGIDVFSADGTYLGYDTLISNLDPGTETVPTIRVAWKDDNDVFYLIDYREYPTVQAVRLNLSIKM